MMSRWRKNGQIEFTPLLFGYGDAFRTPGDRNVVASYHWIKEDEAHTIYIYLLYAFIMYTG